MRDIYQFSMFYQYCRQLAEKVNNNGNICYHDPKTISIFKVEYSKQRNNWTRRELSVFLNSFALLCFASLSIVWSIKSITIERNWQENGHSPTEKFRCKKMTKTYDQQKFVYLLIKKKSIFSFHFLTYDVLSPCSLCSLWLSAAIFSSFHSISTRLTHQKCVWLYEKDGNSSYWEQCTLTYRFSWFSFRLFCFVLFHPLVKCERHFEDLHTRTHDQWWWWWSSSSFGFHKSKTRISFHRLRNNALKSHISELNTKANM